MLAQTPSEFILEFSQGCPAWQQDAIRRLYTQSEYTETDFQETLKLMKAEYGLPVEGEPPQPQPLALEHLVTRNADSPDVALHQVSDIANVNKLLGDQVLRFAPQGMTVIFGENGSGKSGYCRILKQVCRIIQDAQEDVLPDVYEENPGTPEAKVKYAVGADHKELDWQEGAVPTEDLARISIFDSLAATFYTDKDKKVEFVPFQLDIFERLGEVCKHIEEKFKEEMAACQKIMAETLPEIPDNTRVKALLSVPPSTTVIEQLQKMGLWTTDDDKEVTLITKKLGTDPAIRLERLRQYKTALGALSRELKGLLASLDDMAINTLNAKKQAAKTAKEAAELAAKNFGEAEIQLPGTGGEAWRQLFMHAKRYSEVAYPGQKPPVIGNDARCVLCQQALDSESKVRFTSFEAFIEGAAAQEAKTKEADAMQAQQTLARITAREASEVQQLLSDLEEPVLVQTLTTGFQAASKRLLELKPNLNAEAVKIDELSELPAYPEAALTEVTKKLDDEIAALEKALEDRSVFEKLAADLGELNARKVLHDHLTTFVNCLKAKLLYAELEGCAAGCKTTEISRQGGVARKMFISKEFEAQINQEIETLDLVHIPFKVAERSERGHHMLGVKLNVSKSHKPSKILSQGEHRALALVCFLAEVATVPGHDGIIVDDPVSSLDHRRRRLVAQRLVEEAKNRQVIVFTHDLVFLHELELAATKERVPRALHSIRKTSEGFGHVKESTAPWAAMIFKDRMKHLNEQIAEIRQIEDCDSEEYKRKVMQYYKDLRDTWERFVEEVLFYEVVQRFSLGVQTTRLHSVEVTDEDYRAVFFNMGKASEYCHDEAIAVQRPFPKIPEIEEDLATLRDLAKDIRNRQENVRSTRKALTDAPPQAELV